MADTGIVYLDAVWNVTKGCTPELPCWARCWARGMSVRLKAAGVPRYADGFAPRFNREVLAEPLHMKRPRRIGVSFMGDLFADGITDEQIAAVFGVMAACPQHTFMILTKRPARMRAWFDYVQRPRSAVETPDVVVQAVAHGMIEGFPVHPVKRSLYARPWPLPNVWLGVSVSTQADVDARLPLLLASPAALRFVSVEPLLAPVTLSAYYLATKMPGGRYPFPTLEEEYRTKLVDLIDLVIVGGESGADARPLHPAWVRALRDECAASSTFGRGRRTVFFWKQWGSWAPTVTLAPRPVAFAGKLMPMRCVSSTNRREEGRLSYYAIPADADGSVGDVEVMRRAARVEATPELDGVRHAATPFLTPPPAP